MELPCSPSLPRAHQQIRLGDDQASRQNWSAAIDHYTTAINDFKLIEKNFHDHQLVSIINAQIEQCERMIRLFQLRDRAERIEAAQLAERSSRITRARSSSCIKETTKNQRPLARHNTVRVEGGSVATGHGETGSFASVNLSKKTILPVAKAKKIAKHDSQKIEELKLSNEALKLHLKAAFDSIERLKNENQDLRLHKERTASSDVSPAAHSMLSSQDETEEIEQDQNEDGDTNNELELTL